MKQLSKRDRQILAGMYLSKFDREAVEYLGFSSFIEAFNVIGYALGGKPTSIKNYMQEFDPIFPNSRKGWNQRPLRDHCRKIHHEFGDLALPVLAQFISSLILNSSRSLPKELEEVADLGADIDEESPFSKRLLTGAAAEAFFENSFPEILEFRNHSLTDVSYFGCGFDFQVKPESDAPFLAIEVKGLSGEKGEIMMTPKEYRIADFLGNRYYLCIVKNFLERPRLELVRNPLRSVISFSQRIATRTVESWHASV